MPPIRPTVPRPGPRTPTPLPPAPSTATTPTATVQVEKVEKVEKADKAGTIKGVENVADLVEARPIGGLSRVTGATPSSAPRGTTTTNLVRGLGLSSADLVKAAVALAKSDSPLGADVKRALDAAARIDLSSGPYPRRSRDAVAVTAVLVALRPFLKDGGVDTAALAKAGGGELLPVLERAALRAEAAPQARTNFAFLSDVVQVLGFTQTKEAALDVVNAFFRDDAILPRDVQALDAVKAMVANDRFRDEGLVAVQHLLPTSLALFEALVEKGMEPSRIHVLGTPYGSNPLVVAVLHLMGIDVQNGVDKLGATQSFEEQRTVDIHQWLLRRGEKLIADKPPGGYMLLDDGGLLQLAASGDKLPASMPADLKAQWVPALGELFPPDTHAVEQTTRGITELTKHALRFPTVSVAQCDAKKLEGDVIGHALVDSLMTALAQRGRLDARNITVVSAGTVGTQTALMLRELGYDVTLVDTDAGKRAAAEAKGFKTAPVVDRALAKGSDVIYSCTGRTALSGDALVDFGGVLVSGSSMAIEFDTRQLGSFRTTPLDVVNRARPANFDGTGHENLSKEQIGVTRAILFGALAQKVDRAKPGLVDVDRGFQDAAIGVWQETGGGTRPHPVKPVGRHADKSVRPDALSSGLSARHDEWVTFFAGLARPVCPRPTENTRMPGPYFFQGEDGAVRFVDTRGDGKSLPVPLPGVPESVSMTDLRAGTALTVVCRAEDGTRTLFEVMPGDPPTGQMRAKAIGDVVGAPATFYVEERDGFDPLPRGRPDNQRQGFVFRAAGEDKLYVRDAWGSSSGGSWRTVPLPPGTDPATTMLLQPHAGFVLVVDKGDEGRPARLSTVLLQNDPRATSAAAAVGLPGGMTRVEAIALWNDPTHIVQPVVVLGHDAHGKPVAGVLSPVPSTTSLPLPDDAVFRNLRPKPNGKPGVFIVEYTLPGDVVEKEHFRQVEIDAFANLKTTDEAAFSFHARLREALDS